MPRKRHVPRKHSSLKQLLKLDTYDFMPDVNVSEAQVGLGWEGQMAWAAESGVRRLWLPRAAEASPATGCCCAVTLL